jgi:hypothetical protein
VNPEARDGILTNGIPAFSTRMAKSFSYNLLISLELKPINNEEKISIKSYGYMMVDVGRPKFGVTDISQSMTGHS